MKTKFILLLSSVLVILGAILKLSTTNKLYLFFLIIGAVGFIAAIVKLIVSTKNIRWNTE